MNAKDAFARVDTLCTIAEQTCHRAVPWVPFADLRVVLDLAEQALAQAGEAGTAETVKHGSVHEHAVAESDAPNLKADHP